LRLNCRKPRFYVSISKNHEFLANYLQFALNWHSQRIDTKSDRWDPPCGIFC
jgi:hypothetical protein